ncbi:MAG: flagellar basal body-associated FliL family protein [Candidatus Accumulibacter sp.]|jgi:flagellar FliL protein|nr:flagellar basal body-associated FliL family protein [Accumulibacter sp.]
MAESDREDAAPKGGKKVLILIIVAFLLALAVGGGVTYYLMSRHAAEETEDEEEVVEEKPKRVERERRKPAPVREIPPPVYVALEAFTVNLAPENGDQFLHVVVSVEIADEPVGEKIKVYTPKLRNNIMLLLSSQKASELASREGKQKVSDEIRDLMNEIIEPGSSRGRPEYAPIREVLFTTFIIQ